MMTLRRQMPAYSPIRFASLLAGTAGALGLGDPRAALRSLLAAHYGTDALLATDSGTTALRLAIRGALAVRGGDTVALPAYCCYDVATAAIGAGAKVRLYDLDPTTLGPDWGSLERALRGGTGAVVLVHLYGVPVDVDRAWRLGREYGALVIEDAAQGIGGSIAGRPLGAHGSLGVLSFGRGKGVTGGGGGAVLANDDEGQRALAAIGERVAPGGRGVEELIRLAAQWLLGRPRVYGLPASLPWLGLGETHYREPSPPRGIARGAAAALVANWEASLAEAEVRREKAARLQELLERMGRRPIDGAGVGGWLRFPALRPAGGASVPLEQEAIAEGIAPGYPLPLRDLPALASLLGEAPAGPGAARLARSLVTLPVHSRVRSPGPLGIDLAGSDLGRE